MASGSPRFSQNSRLDFDWRLHPVQISKVQLLKESLQRDPAGVRSRRSPIGFRFCSHEPMIMISKCRLALTGAQPLKNTCGLGLMRGAFSEESLCLRCLAYLATWVMQHPTECFKHQHQIEHPVQLQTTDLHRFAMSSWTNTCSPQLKRSFNHEHNRKCCLLLLYLFCEASDRSIMHLISGHKKSCSATIADDVSILDSTSRCSPPAGPAGRLADF